jgi:uncharacterized membrane protein YdjX (TVP38/TMEM64 family)
MYARSPKSTTQSQTLGRSIGSLGRLTMLAAVVLVAAIFVYRFRGQLEIHTLAARESQLRAYYQAHPIQTLAIAFLAYVAVTGLSLPGAAAMSVLCGWLFGFARALVLVSFASTAGATIAFLLSRYFFGRAIQARYGARLATFNAAMEHEGAFYLFTLRLIPQVPFFVVNVAMGLTKLPVHTFWWVSQLGMLPGTIVFVLAGASAPTLKKVADEGLSSILDWRLMTALVLLGLLPLGIKWALRLASITKRADDPGGRSSC